MENSEAPVVRMPLGFKEVNIQNFDALSPAEKQRMLDEAWEALHEGRRKQDAASELAAEASDQIAEASRVIELLRSQVERP